MAKKVKKVQQKKPIIASKTVKKAAKTTRTKKSTKAPGAPAPKRIPLPLLGYTPLLKKTISQKFHDNISYWYNGTELKIHSILSQTGTIDIQQNPLYNAGVSMYKKDKVITKGGVVRSEWQQYSHYIDYYYIYLEQQQQPPGNASKKTDDQKVYVFAGLGPQVGSQPAKWDIRLTHDYFSQAFRASYTQQDVKPYPIYHLSLKKNLKPIKHFELNPNPASKAVTNNRRGAK